MTNRSRIALDMDEVMADTLTAWLAEYNRGAATQITKADLLGRKIYDVVGPEQAAVARAYLDHPDFFLDLPVMEQSQTVIEQLAQRFDVFVASAAMDHPNSFPAKYTWLKTHFPFIPDRNIVFCGDKSIIRADYMIDDSIPNLQAFTGQGIVFTSPHNALNGDFPRVNSWAEVARYFQLV